MRNGAYGADKFGFRNLTEVRWNSTEPSLYEYAISAGEASLVAGGALCAETGHHTGRSPKDKHTVVDDLTRDLVWWDGNRKMSKENFDNLLADFLKHAEGKKLFAQDLYGGADPKYRIKTRIFTELAWHSLFIRQLLIRPERTELATFVPDLTILDFPSFKPDAKRHGGREGSDTMVAIDFDPQDRADLRFLVRRRDEEVGVYDPQFLSAGAKCRADALLGQCQPRGRERVVLWSFGNGQDHAFGRP